MASDISEQLIKFKSLVEQSNKILVTSHISPDPDSICSILLLGTTLELNYPNKHVIMHSEEQPYGLEYLHGYKKLKVQPLKNVLQDVDLIIVVDAMNFVRISRNDWQEVAEKVKEQGTALAIIDHHEPVGVEDNKVYINQGFPAAAQEVYDICFNKLNLKKPEGYAQTTMVGLYSDTGGFAFLNDRYKDTLNLVSDLLDEGVKVEVIKNQLNQYTEDQMKSLAEAASNISHEQGYSYTFLRDAFVDNWLTQGKLLVDLQMGLKNLCRKFYSNIDGRTIGVTTYKDPRLGENYYSASFRSVGGDPDMSVIAQKFGGGGHKGAAGAKVQAAT